MANIQNELNNIKSAIYGKDVRNSIHDAIKQCYDDASVNNDNANMEVKLARGSHNTLNDRLVENEKKQEKISSQLDNKVNKTYVDGKIGSLGSSKTFKGSCLYSALPISANIDDYWYVTDRTSNFCWNGTTWVDIGNGVKIGENVITPKETDFALTGDNKFNIDDVRFGVMCDPRSGKIVETSNPNYYSVMLKVKPNAKYLYGMLNTVKDNYIKVGVGFTSFLDVNKNLLSYITSYDTEYIETPSNCYYILHSLYSTLTYESLNDKKPMFVLQSYCESFANMINKYVPFKYILDTNRLEIKELKEFKIPSNLYLNDWYNKIGVTYGDSITAINNPDSPVGSWGAYVKDYFKLKTLYGRGIGGQTYSWGENGGSVAFINSDGTLNSRNDSFNYDNYTGEIPIGTTKVRGAFCSWSRITAMIPTTIKDSIDFIYVMGGSNDIPGNGTSMGNHTFVKGSEIDVEWKNSSYYNGGDFDITTYIGGMCSTIMKLQAWCPNAVIIVGTPPNGRASSNPNTNETSWCKNSLGLYYIDYIKEQELVLKDFGIPCIDVYGTSGINPFNRTSYITDWVHPYSDKGCKAIARAIIGGLKTIIPNI